MGTLGNRPPAGKGFQFVVSLQCGFHATSQQQIASFFLWRTEREVSSSKTGEGCPAQEVTVGNALIQVLPVPGTFHGQQDSGQGSFLALFLSTIQRSHLPFTSSSHHRQFCGQLFIATQKHDQLMILTDVRRFIARGSRSIHKI